MRLRATLALMLLVSAAGCGKKAPALPAPEETPPPAENACKPAKTYSGIGASGTARAFQPDPMSGSGNTLLSPNSSSLENWQVSVSLQRLKGTGVLEGEWMTMVNGATCDLSFGASDPGQTYEYVQRDERFAEVNAYAIGDPYRAFLADNGAGVPAASLPTVVHCGAQDNAFYLWTSKGGIVCLGDSSQSPGSSYADDGIVTLHELQHASTMNLYSPSPYISMDGFWVGEGGAINEALSDFMSLLYTEPMITSPAIDPLVFGRWSLGLFDPGWSAVRGMHRCPQYDPDYPRCGNFPAISAENGTLSYRYPGGIGWPYANNELGPNYLKQVSDHNYGPEEIHTSGVMFGGALWEVYDRVKTHLNDIGKSQRFMTRLLSQTLKALPYPTTVAQSPIHFISFAEEMVNQVTGGVTGFSADAALLTAVEEGLQIRGLRPAAAERLPAGWADLGPGETNPGVKIVDSPSKLKEWVMDIFGGSTDFGLIPQGVSTGLNSRLDPGEVAVVWFDIKNLNALSAGSIYLKVKLSVTDSEWVSFYQSASTTLNIGAVTTAETHMIYPKIYGSDDVAALTTVSAGKESYRVNTSSTYFGTNPYFSRTYWTGVWVKVNPQAPSGTTVTFLVDAQPSNGESASLAFPVVIR